MDVRLKRAYEPAAGEDGYRVLVERLWPRGISRERAHLDEWAKEISPSPELRRWYGHDPPRFEEFRRRYLDELAEHAEKLEELRRRTEAGPLTLVYGAKDEARNSAVVLEEAIRIGIAKR